MVGLFNGGIWGLAAQRVHKFGSTPNFGAALPQAGLGDSMSPNQFTSIQWKTPVGVA